MGSAPASSAEGVFQVVKSGLAVDRSAPPLPALVRANEASRSGVAGPLYRVLGNCSGSSHSDHLRQREPHRGTAQRQPFPHPSSPNKFDPSWTLAGASQAPGWSGRRGTFETLRIWFHHVPTFAVPHGGSVHRRFWIPCTVSACQLRLLPRLALRCRCLVLPPV